MAACTRCRTELATGQIGCQYCSPPPDPALLDAIERSPTWHEASRAHIPAARGGSEILIGIVIVLGFMSLGYDGYSAAVDRGDTSGRPVVIGGALFCAALVAWGTYQKRAPLHRSVAQFLANTWSVSNPDGRGPNTTWRYLHVFARTGLRELRVDHYEMTQALTPGQPVIVFERRGRIDAVWPVSLAHPAPGSPAPAPGPAAPASASPPSIGDGGVGLAGLASVGTGVAWPPPLAPGQMPDDSAHQLLRALDPAQIERARTAPVALPLFVFTPPLIAVGVTAFLLLLASGALFDGPGKKVVDLEAYAERVRIGSIVLYVLAAASAGVVVFLARRAVGKPIERELAVVIDTRVVRSGRHLTREIATVLPDGTRRLRSARTSLVPRLGEPVVLCSIDGVVFATLPLR